VKCSSASASFPGGFPFSFGTILIVIVSSPLGWRLRRRKGKAGAGRNRLNDARG